MVILTLDTFIRHLPHRAYVKLSSLLDPGGLWENLAAKIPLNMEDIDDNDAQPRYTHQQIAVFALMGQRTGSGNSPTQRVLIDWGTRNARVSHLIKVLLRAEYYAAANYLNNDLLNLGIIPPPVNDDDPQPLPPMGDSDAIPDPKSRENQEEKDMPGGKNNPEQNSSSQNVDSLCDSFDGMSSDGGTLSDRMSCFSDHRDSVLAMEGVLLSQLRRHSLDCREDSEDGWIGLKDIEIQTIEYAMLSGVTNDFNTEPLEKGGNLVGAGGFGKVFLGKFRNGFKIAVKFLMQSESMRKEDLNLLIKQFETEVKMLSTYRHENVVHLLGYSIDGPSQCLVYQYLPNGSLEDRLSRYQGTPPLSANMRLKIVMGTAHGIRFLNDKGYVHRDIKTANILLDSEFNAKVGDFATVVSAPSGDSKTIVRATTVIGTPAYLAPEAINFDISTKLDSYSFGVVLLEVITGLPAQDNRREETTISNHIMENVEEPSEIHSFVDQSAGAWSEGAVDKLYDISMRCLIHQKRKRPNVKDILPELEEL
ncbi:interleukin-1 receptor-associated kinase 4-like [Littorina saxatilis]|uniref:non-specific serine/threonine protein kinase n=1 Tax=Littorina saxatilis TaxID=31220 RepID=A0AAN9ANQ8_9CAEN